MKKFQYISLLSILTWSLTGSHISYAAFVESLPVWTHVVSACTPDESSNYRFTNATFSFFGETTSNNGLLANPIVVRCNVTNPLDGGNPLWNTLIIGYQDPDGQGTDALVTASLIRVARPTGSLSTLASFSSNLFATTSKTEGRAAVAQNFDFLKYEYYVEIRLYRQTTTYNPQAFSARLTRITQVPD